MKNTTSRGRRALLKKGSLALAAPLMTAGVLRAQTPEAAVRWRMATSWPVHFPIFEHGALRFSEKLHKITGGRFIIDVDPATKHKAPLGVFDFVQGGQYEMGHSCSYYWKGKDPALSILTTNPFGMTAQEQNAWYWYGGGIELQNKAYAPYGMYSYNAGNTAVQMGGWFRKEINSVQDLKGLKMRIPGLAGEVLARLGAAPTNIPAGELYMALEKKVIDALEWVGPHQDMSMGFQKIAEYYYTGWHEPGAELQYLINRRAYDALPPDLQAAMQVAMKESSFDMLCESVYRNSMSWQQLTREHPDVKIRHFPRAVLAVLRRETDALLDEMSAASPIMQAIVASRRAFLAKVRMWTATAEQGYLHIRGQAAPG